MNHEILLILCICLFEYLGVTSKFERDFRISTRCEIVISHHMDKQKIAITRLI